LKYNAVCGGNEDLPSALLNEELDIHSEDDVNFEILSECGSEESSDELSDYCKIERVIIVCSYDVPNKSIE
jgi:hypothetical protein